ncbi:hypothetical protein RM844_10935 [Streptomyces sp. DSM 44915]|uniref:Uncharacterized protein n=1 Tax=Streptomyces chisholmiae TaxID=3075540 RepID=A0ABU2JP86_9ACTN|nr:hypothetical protein [Streptomyces sp. DSM 44915]MDT0266807.1 hypothetical protein [Streptomyces sp. DSM 44915]
MTQRTAADAALATETERLRRRDLRLAATEAAVERLTEDPGRRRELTAEIDELLAGHDPRPGDTVLVDTRDGRLDCRLRREADASAEAAAEAEGMPPPG